METQSSLAQTLYAQLLEEASAYSVAIFDEGLTGSPYVNKAGGHEYLYWQVRTPGGQFKRTSLGRRSPQTEALVEDLLRRRNTAAELAGALKATARAFVAVGGMPAEPAHFKVIEHLARASLFSKGAVLIGSHAFVSLGNMLGARWNDSMKTTDMDFARAAGVALAIPDADEHIDVPSSVKAFDRSYFEVPQLSHKNPSTSMMSHKTKVKIDFLTTLTTRKEEQKPYYFADLGIAAEPLKYMDYLLGGGSVRGIIVGAHAIPVNLPDPARFAIHKLVIAQERSSAQATKATKDIRQASELLEALLETGREYDVKHALDGLRAESDGMANLARSVERTKGAARDMLAELLARLP